MFLPTIKFDKTLIASAISLVFISVTPTAMATVITAKADYSINGGLSVNDTETSSTDPSSIDILSSAGSFNNNVFYHTFGNTSGNFGARVSGSGIFDITSSYTFFNTYTNSSTASEDFNFDFTVIPGEIRTSGTLVTGESLFTSYNLGVMIDFDQDGVFDSTIFNSAASITTTSAGSVHETSGTSLTGANYSENSGSAEYSWSSFSDSIFVGSILPSDSFDLQYILTTTARGNVSNTDCGEGFHDGGEGFIDDGGEGFTPCGEAIARSGDPFGFQNTANISSSPTPNNPVPAPSGLALLGLSFSAIYVYRRKKLKLSK